MKYTTSYSSSNGQPTNGHETHETLNAALAAWAANLGALIGAAFVLLFLLA